MTQSMMSQTKLYHVTQIMQLWSCDQNLVTQEFNMKEVIIISVYKNLTRKTLNCLSQNLNRPRLKYLL